MPSVSKKQQKFMGIVRSIQKGEQPASKFSKSAQDAAKKMKKKDVEKYAKTKHKNLPSKVRQEIEEYVDSIVDGIEQELMTKEGFASDAQRRAAFASGYKAKGKKKKKEGVKEGKFTKIMKAVRKGPKAGPWTFIISKNNKIKKQVSVKNIKEIPAYYEDLKKAYPNDKIGIEAKDGKIVYRESVNEGTCGYGIDGKIGEEPAGPNLMKKIKKISKDKENKKLLKSKIKEVKPIKLKGKSGMGKISHLGVPQPSKGVEKLFKIADKGFDKVGGVTVDGMSASLFKQIYNKANDDIKNKLNKKSEKELVRIIGRMWDKFGKNVKIGSSL